MPTWYHTNTPHTTHTNHIQIHIHMMPCACTQTFISHLLQMDKVLKKGVRLLKPERPDIRGFPPHTTHTHVHAHAHARTRTCTYTHTHVHAHTCSCSGKRTHTRTCTSTAKHKHIDSLTLINTRTHKGLDDLYELMLKCWHADWKSRPNFSEIYAMLTEIGMILFAYSANCAHVHICLQSTSGFPSS